MFPIFDGDLRFGDRGLAFGCDPDGYSTLDLSNTELDPFSTLSAALRDFREAVATKWL